jgi:tetratricopeptide (TPR) repeat protein
MGKEALVSVRRLDGMPKHPDRETLRRFVTGGLPSEDAHRIDHHLSICSGCRDHSDKISTGLTRLLESWLRPGYDETFARAADRAAERLAHFIEDSRSSGDLLAELLQTPAHERRRRIAGDEKFHSPKLSQLFQSRSREAWSSDRNLALEMADCAVEVTQHLGSGRYGSSIVEDARALAWAYLGNAFRISSDLWRAERALQQAWLHHALAGEDAHTETELLMFTASLRKDQHRYGEALQLSDRAISIFREVEDRYLEGTALILKGVILGRHGQILGEHGRIRQALPILRAGLERIDPERDPELVFKGKHNLILFLAEGGAPRKAWKMFEQERYLQPDLGSVDLARYRWIEGRIATNLSEFARAEPALREARDSFLSCDLGIEVFLTSLDLAQVYALSGRLKQVKETLRELIPLGEALGLDKDVVLARLLYEQASRG